MTSGPDRRVLISGCSGGGKSALVGELSRRGFATVAEPGRRVVAEALRAGTSALPWIDMTAFARRVMEVSDADLRSATAGLVFFDRGLVDAAAALAHATGEPMSPDLAGRFDATVFLAPPWPDIYVTDAERRHGFDEAVAKYERLRIAYTVLGCEALILPRIAVPLRADWIMASLGTSTQEGMP